MRRHGGTPPPGTIDFSSPMNPLPPPSWLGKTVRSCVEEEAYRRYYDPELSELKDLIAKLEGIKGEIHVGNGSASILANLPAVLKPTTMIVVEPNFGDHHIQAPALQIPLHRIKARITGNKLRVDTGRLERARNPLIIVSRPNNPTGMEIDPSDLRALEDYAEENSGVLVVDEAFQPLSSLQPWKPRGHRTVILRSLTKAMAAPGLRLGYMHTKDEDIHKKMEQARQPWPLDSITYCTYTRLLREMPGEVRSYIDQGRRAALEWGQDLAAMLTRAGARTYPTTTAYILVWHSIPHPRLGIELARRGVYVRDASTFHGLDEHHSRISIRSPEENDVLARVMAQLLGGKDGAA
ncbi:MAG: aminotransferase class I/II-fold pyridoxal phosphate-dependent enzyme [Desulfurococcales archaeon]|nr:aminotransferase class I/II-fold pyridoxal phosphate-dependent enzyme [Desulfurococcales archaeon]